MMTDRELKQLVTKAHRLSQKTKFGPYPMAPSVGLTEREVERHRPAMDACFAAAKALVEAGRGDEARELERAGQSHSWVVRRRGTF